MGFLIDASVLIDHERGRVDLQRKLAGRGGEELFLSVVTASELLHGVHRARDPRVRARRSALTEGLFERFPILPLDMATARVHAHLSAHLASIGWLIGPNDLWLASTAMVHGLALVTTNLREFRRVPGLSLESWGTS